MNPKKNTVAVTFRCDVAVADQLDELCRMMGIKRSEFLISAITSEYDKMQGNPKLKDMLEQFKQITETMKQMTGQANAGTPAGIGDGAGAVGEGVSGAPANFSCGDTLRPPALINLIIREYVSKT